MLVVYGACDDCAPLVIGILVAILGSAAALEWCEAILTETQQSDAFGVV
jgi:hypothetical protein